MTRRHFADSLSESLSESVTRRLSDSTYERTNVLTKNLLTHPSHLTDPNARHEAGR